MSKSGSENGDAPHPGACSEVEPEVVLEAVVSCSGRIAKRLAELALLELVSRGSEV
jgi:hypothetical protein